MSTRRTSDQDRRIDVSSEAFFATKKLKEFGLSEKQLAGCYFLPKHMGVPFRDWAFTWDPSIPSAIDIAIIPFLRPYLTHRWVTSDAPTGHASLPDAWEELQQFQIAPALRIASNFKENQRAKSKRSRKTNYILSLEKTISEVVAEFYGLRGNIDADYQELWPRFFSHLETLDLDPKELEGEYEYNIGHDKRRLINYDQFKRLIRKARFAGVT